MLTPTPPNKQHHAAAGWSYSASYDTFHYWFEDVYSSTSEWLQTLASAFCEPSRPDVQDLDVRMFCSNPSGKSRRITSTWAQGPCRSKNEHTRQVSMYVNFGFDFQQQSRDGAKQPPATNHVTSQQHRHTAVNLTVSFPIVQAVPVLQPRPGKSEPLDQSLREVGPGWRQRCSLLVLLTSSQPSS